VRLETDSIGGIEVPEDKYWGAQTQRSIEYFSIGTDLMPIEVIHAYGILKKAAALVNNDLGLLDDDKRDMIVSAAEDVVRGQAGCAFPLARLDDRQRHADQHE